MRIVAHIDMDAFYAAVEEQLNPALRALPLVVGADPKEGTGRGVVMTANYAARRFGIRSALPISRAWRLAESARKRGEPATLFVRPNMALYRAASDRIMEIVKRYGDAFEEASIDEAYLEISSQEDFTTAAKSMAALKTEIRNREGIGCSIGLGPNKLIAKIASGEQKPDGFTIIPHDFIQNFLDPLPIRKIPGIGPKSERFLHEHNLRTIGELREVPAPILIEWFGKWGARLFEKCRGIDASPVTNEWTRKSLGEQETFAQDTRTQSLVSERLDCMAERIMTKLQAKDFARFHTITVTVRFSDFQTSNRSRTIRDGIAVDEDALSKLRHQAAALLTPFFDERENPRGKAFRLIGLRVEKLF
jgi:DNA polymerase IV (archaeal DinB-like DNA polymerase)